MIDQYNKMTNIEWQANEGAAEFLVPASMVLGIVKERYPLIKKESDVWKLKHELVNKFNVSDQIIKYRLEALKYEIDQCVNGVAINDIEFISRSVQNTRKLEIQSLKRSGRTSCGSRILFNAGNTMRRNK